MAVTRDSSETIKQGKRHLYKMYVYGFMGPGKQMGGTTTLVVKLHHLQKRALINSLGLPLVRPYLGYCMQLWTSPLLSPRKTFSRGPHSGPGGNLYPVGRG